MHIATGRAALNGSIAILYGRYKGQSRAALDLIAAVIATINALITCNSG